MSTNRTPACAPHRFFSAHEAVTYRDSIVVNLQRQPDLHGARWCPVAPARIVLRVADWLLKSEIVLWDEDLWMAAQSGAVAAFEGKPWNLSWPDGRSQFWLLDNHGTANRVQFTNPDFRPPDDKEYSHVGFLIGKLDGEYLIMQACNPAYPLGNIPAIHSMEELFDAAAKRWLMCGKITEGAPAGPSFAYLLAAWHFMNSPLVEVDRNVWSRQVRRAAERKQRELPPVGIVRLRRRESHRQAGTDQHVEWNSRWLVRGHWRDQWFPSAGEHKTIFIAPYVKGPEEKPIKQPRQSIYAVVQ